MKKFITLLFSVLLVVAVTIAQNETYMFVSLYLTPKSGHVQQLNTALSTHNKIFHSEEPYTASVHFISSGKYGGDYCWLMGPCTFTDLDSEPFGHENHDNDWNNNVLPHVEKQHTYEYWQRDNDRMYEPDDNQFDKLHIHAVKTKRGMESAFAEHFEDIVAVYNGKNYESFIALYWNKFPTAHGRNLAAVEGFSNWAQFDDDNWVSDFEEVHGEGSWGTWVEKLNEITEWVDQEVRQIVPGLSGME